MSTPIRVLELRSVRGTGGGPEKTIMLGAARADRNRFEVTVCYIRDQRDRVFRLDERAASLGIDYVEVFERHSLDRAIWPQLRRIVRERRIDIVHAHEYKTDLLALLLAERERVIPLATVHGWTGQSPRERRLYYPIDRFLLARYPRLIAVSGEIRARLIESGTSPERVSVVLNGIDHLAFRRDRAREADARRALGFGPEHFVIGAVGRLEAQKRFDLLIEAFARLHAGHPSARLVIAGDGSLMPALRDQAAAQLTPGTYALLGHTDDVSAVHHGLDVLAQSSDYEGTPNAVLEAMAFETPIVATDAGGTAELSQHGTHAVIVPAGRPDLLADALADTFGNRAAALDRAAAARRRIEAELSFEARMQTVEELYRELVTESGRMWPRRGFLRWASFESARNARNS